MFSTMKNVISRGGFSFSDTIKKINIAWAEGVIDTDQKQELIDLARRNAKPENDYDVFAKISELEQRVRLLEESQSEKPDVDDGYPDVDDGFLEEYKAGKWYYRGDKVAFKGYDYICVAPENAVCTWSPEEYPAYWESIND